MPSSKRPPAFTARVLKLAEYKMQHDSEIASLRQTHNIRIEEARDIAAKRATKTQVLDPVARRKFIDAALREHRDNARTAIREAAMESEAKFANIGLKHVTPAELDDALSAVGLEFEARRHAMDKCANGSRVTADDAIVFLGTRFRTKHGRAVARRLATWANAQREAIGRLLFEQDPAAMRAKRLLEGIRAPDLRPASRSGEASNVVEYLGGITRRACRGKVATLGTLLRDIDSFPHTGAICLRDVDRNARTLYDAIGIDALRPLFTSALAGVGIEPLDLHTTQLRLGYYDTEVRRLLKQLRTGLLLAESAARRLDDYKRAGYFGHHASPEDDKIGRLRLAGRVVLVQCALTTIFPGATGRMVARIAARSENPADSTAAALCARSNTIKFAKQDLRKSINASFMAYLSDMNPEVREESIAHRRGLLKRCAEGKKVRVHRFHSLSTKESIPKGASKVADVRWNRFVDWYFRAMIASPYQTAFARWFLGV